MAICVAVTMVISSLLALQGIMLTNPYHDRRSGIGFMDPDRGCFVGFAAAEIGDTR
jgi:hypothetical protein